MAGSNRPYTQLDSDQVLRQSFDEENDRLRVDATVSASIGSLEINAEDSDVAIKDRITDNLLKIHNDGSIDANVIVSANSGDNIAISDGTDTLAINADGSINAKISSVDLDIRNLLASQDSISISDGSHSLSINSNGSINVNVNNTDFDIRNLSASQDVVSVGNGNNTLKINNDGSIDVNINSLNQNNLSATNDSVSIKNGSNTLKVNNDGSIDVNISTSATDGDNVAISDGTHKLLINPDGSANVMMGSASIPANYDQGIVQYTSPTVETYIYKKSGQIIKTVTITYTNASKNYIAGWVIT